MVSSNAAGAQGVVRPRRASLGQFGQPIPFFHSLSKGYAARPRMRGDSRILTVAGFAARKTRVRIASHGRGEHIRINQQ